MDEKEERSPFLILGIESTCTPGHDFLKRLTGEWAAEGDWYLKSGEAESVTGRTVNTGILGDHFIESKTYTNDIEQSRVIYGYDPDEDQFVGFAINAISNRSDIEYGRLENGSEASLRFSCVEHVGKERIPVRFERRIEFLSADAYDLTITYPDREPDQQLGMKLHMRRTGSQSE